LKLESLFALFASLGNIEEEEVEKNQSSSSCHLEEPFFSDKTPK
jgi:hypothetical protein